MWLSVCSHVLCNIFSILLGLKRWQKASTDKDREPERGSKREDGSVPQGAPTTLRTAFGELPTDHCTVHL